MVVCRCFNSTNPLIIIFVIDSPCWVLILFILFIFDVCLMLKFDPYIFPTKPIHWINHYSTTYIIYSIYIFQFYPVVTIDSMLMIHVYPLTCSTSIAVTIPHYIQFCFPKYCISVYIYILYINIHIIQSYSFCWVNFCIFCHGDIY